MFHLLAGNVLQRCPDTSLHFKVVLHYNIGLSFLLKMQLFEKRS